MIKSFLILINFSILLFSSQQIILVVADDFNTSHAKLECFEGNKIIFKSIDVNIGTNGLGWGVGTSQLSKTQNIANKHEGDKKAPVGIFKLNAIFGYAEHSHYLMPYIYTSNNLICVDDVNSKFYNKIIQNDGNEKSFENMKRHDNQYQLGIVVNYNQKAKKGAGSCIFLHVQRKKNASTAGCTSMKLEDIKKITKWLDKNKKPLLIQIPKEKKEEILKLYPELKSSTLLL